MDKYFGMCFVCLRNAHSCITKYLCELKGCSEEYTAFSASDDLFVNVMNLEDVKFMREKRDAQMSSTITVNNSKGSTEQNTSVTNTTEFTTSQPEEPLSPSPLPNSTYSHPPMMVEV